MRAIPQVLEELRLDPGEVLAEVAIDVKLFADPKNLIQDALIGRALRHCAMRGGRPGGRDRNAASPIGEAWLHPSLSQTHKEIRDEFANLAGVSGATHAGPSFGHSGPRTAFLLSR